jgi:dolichol kinase
MTFFSRLYPLGASNVILATLAAVCITTIAESVSPRGVDNITVPILGALTFLLVVGS